MVLLNVFVTSPDTHSERRLDSGLTIGGLKDKLTPITGISPQYQRLSLFRSSEGNDLISLLDEEHRTLQEYGVRELHNIRVETTDPNAKPGEYSDVSGVDKFELTDEQYEARGDTVLAHLKANKLGRFAPEPTVLAHPPPPSTTVPREIQAGSRCEVGGEGGLARRGTVRWAGVAEIGNGGVWVGVQLDEPMGKGDGEVNGHRYFSCPPKHAVFVRPDKVTVGDYPEEDLLEDDEEI